ncbi:hypothetical protein [Camelimonas lactis]|uniref:Uncharacterized protein n=1 Tax=Camelimonas lactis TaxID=659006 RepID=A0A4V2RXR3_9HYPH|nr:hypothetical protein [Camelimonas lactis]TCO15207.1 hypothetical protein EV666_102185 [Camelimonas lactis]
MTTPYQPTVKSSSERHRAPVVPLARRIPKGSPVKVSTFDWERGDMTFRATVTGATSDSHVRILTDDGLVFAVPASDCEIIHEDGVT